MQIWLVKRLVTRLVEASITNAEGLAALFEEARKDRSVLNRLKAIVRMSMLEHRSAEDLKTAQKYATVVINSVYMQQISSTCMNAPLDCLWQIIFDWSVPIDLKRNLENSLVHLIAYWNTKLENVFELGIKRSIEWLTKTRYGKPYPLSSNYQIANSQLQSSLQLSFSITDKLPDIQDVIIFLSTCITTAIRQGTKDPRGLKYLFETLNPYVVLIRQKHKPMQDIQRPHRSYTLLLRLLNYILESCSVLDLQTIKQYELCKEFLARLDFEDSFLMKIYQIGSKIESKSKCLCCIRFQIETYDDTILELKLEAAKLHLQLNRHRQHLLREKKSVVNQYFINNTFMTVSCMQGPLHRTRFNCWRAVEFASYIIEIYLFYIEEYFCHLEEEHLTIVDSLVKEVLKVGEFEQSLYEDNFEEFYDLVDNCMKNRSKRHPKVVAARMLHCFALRSQSVLDYLTDLILTGFKSKQNYSKGQTKSFCPQTSLFLLGIIFDLLPPDSPLPHQLLHTFNSPKLLDLPDLSFCLLLLISKHHFTRMFTHPSSCEYLILQGIRNRSSGLVRLLALELAEMSSRELFNWEIFQSIYDELDRHSEVEFIERMSHELKWSYLFEFVKEHLRKFDRERLDLMLRGMKDRIREELARIRLGYKTDEAALMKSVEVVDLIVSDRYFVLMADDRLRRTLRDFHQLRSEAGNKQSEIKANLLVIIGKLLAVQQGIPTYLLQILPSLVEQFSNYPKPSLLILFSQYLVAYNFVPNQPFQVVQIYDQVMNHLESSAHRFQIGQKHLMFIEDMLVVLQGYIYAVRYGVMQSQLERVVRVCNVLLEKKVLRARVVSTYALASMYINDSLSLQDILEQCEYGTFRGAEAEVLLSYFPRIMEEINKNSFDKFQIILTTAYIIVRQHEERSESIKDPSRPPQNIAKFSYPWQMKGNIEQKGLAVFLSIRNRPDLYDLMLELSMIPDQIEGHFLNIEESSHLNHISWSLILTNEDSPSCKQEPDQLDTSLH